MLFAGLSSSMVFCIMTTSTQRPDFHPASLCTPTWSNPNSSWRRMETSFEEHLPIVRALKRRDPDAAEAAMRAHLRSAWESLVVTLTHPHPTTTT